MKKFIIMAATVLFSSTQLFGLHETNCSNYDGSVKRVEQEIWGANPIQYIVDGEVLDVGFGLGDLTAELIDKNVLREGTFGDFGGTFEHFTATLEIVDPTATFPIVSELVICYAWENNAID